MIKSHEILETKSMIHYENLDIRTLTMGINLLDCADSDLVRFNEKIYQKITSNAKDLVKVANQLEKEYGIPIVNKRIAITPIAMAASACDNLDYLEIAKTLDKAAKELEVDFIGGFSAIVDKGMSVSDQRLIDQLPIVLSNTDRVCSSINLGSTKHGLNMEALSQMGPMIKEMAERTQDKDSIACAKFVAFCNAVDDNPFMAGAFHGLSMPDVSLSVGVSGPGVVKAELDKYEFASFDELSAIIQETVFKFTRAGEFIGKEAAERLGVDFGIIDLSLAPTPEIGDSIAEIFETMGLEFAGAYGTTLALAMLNDAVKKGGLMASTHVGGLSGAFIPVTEDQGMIRAVEKNALNLEKLEAMTSVCSVGLDMVAIPGHIHEDIISGMIADESAIGMINNKTTAVRVIPVYGKNVGDTVHFGGLLGYGPIMPVNEAKNSKFMKRGGFVPAPNHSFKN